MEDKQSVLKRSPLPKRKAYLDIDRAEYPVLVLPGAQNVGRRYGKTTRTVTPSAYTNRARPVYSLID